MHISFKKKKFFFGALAILNKHFLVIFNLQLPEFEHSIIISKCVFNYQFQAFSSAVGSQNAILVHADASIMYFGLN